MHGMHSVAIQVILYLYNAFYIYTIQFCKYRTHFILEKETLGKIQKYFLYIILRSCYPVHCIYTIPFCSYRIVYL